MQRTSLRRSHGEEAPYGVRYWQIGNETSYNYNLVSSYDAEYTAKVAKRFAQQMRTADPNINIINDHMTHPVSIGFQVDEWSFSPASVSVVVIQLLVTVD